MTTSLDPTLRRLFEDEAAAELARIEALLPHASDPEAAAALCRHAHTLKGSAAVVGLAEFSRIAGTLEAMFEEMRERRRASTPSFEAIVRATIAALRRIVADQIGGLAVSTTAAAAPAAGSVLVVEDSPTVREHHRAILSAGGYDVRTVGDGAEALRLLEQEPADAVVTDLELPELDGWELTSAIRTRPELAGIGVVVVSSRSDDDARRRSAGAGADAHLIKAVEPELLLGSVQRAVARAGS